MLIPELHRIKQIVGAKAKQSKVMNLASTINQRTIRAVHNRTDVKKAVGVDGVSKYEYEARLDENIESLVGNVPIDNTANI